MVIGNAATLAGAGSVAPGTAPDGLWAGTASGAGKPYDSRHQIGLLQAQCPFFCCTLTR